MDLELIKLLCVACGIDAKRVERAFGEDTHISVDVQTTFARAINPHMVGAGLKQQEAELKADVE